MKLLLDTCTFLWLISDDNRLSDKARNLFSNPDNSVFLSVISGWEISVKYQLGKLPLPQAPDKFIPHHREQHRIASLALEEGAVVQLLRLPMCHRDPFDRMLVCQAIQHGLTILTPDALISQYPISVVW